jgi:SAM-dependent methyltransferase
MPLKIKLITKKTDVFAKSLDNPIFFNIIRRIIAGDQHNTKRFVTKLLEKYKVQSIIDIGCGTGDFFYTNFKGFYLGIDNNLRFINYAKIKYCQCNNASFRCEDILISQYLKNKQFDGVLFISMMHHFSNENLGNIFRRIKKLKPKVIIIADITPNPPGLLRRIMAKLDRGLFLRTPKEKYQIISQYFRIKHTQIIHSRLAIQYGIVCIP